MLEAVSALTILRTKREPSTDPKLQAWCLVSFPLVGLLFGLIGFVLIKTAFIKLPVFVAWAVPMTWYVLSGGAHFIGLSRTINALLIEGPSENRFRALTSDKVAAPGTALALAVVIGKMFAILQAQAIDTLLLSFTVLLVPVVSRYTSLLLAISTPSGETQAAPVARQGTVVLFSSLIMAIMAGAGPALMLSLVVGAMCTAMILRIVAMRKFGGLAPAVLGAVLELSEVVLLWIPVIAATSGVHLGMFSLGPLFFK